MDCLSNIKEMYGKFHASDDSFESENESKVIRYELQRDPQTIKQMEALPKIEIECYLSMNVNNPNQLTFYCIDDPVTFNKWVFYSTPQTTEVIYDKVFDPDNKWYCIQESVSSSYLNTHYEVIKLKDIEKKIKNFTDQFKSKIDTNSLTLNKIKKLEK